MSVLGVVVAERGVHVAFPPDRTEALFEEGEVHAVSDNPTITMTDANADHGRWPNVHPR